MHRILPGLGMGDRYLADFSDTVAPFLGLAQALSTACCAFLPPARISTTDLGPRGICLLRSTTLPSPILTPTAGLPPLRMVQRRIELPPSKIVENRTGRKLLPPVRAVKREAHLLGCTTCVVFCSWPYCFRPRPPRPRWWRRC